MKRIISILIIAMLIAMLFGCTNPEPNPVGDTNTQIKVTNQDEASETLNDVSTDISGINQSLNEIDKTLTE